MTENKKTKVYIYTRISTAMQIDGYSLDAQRTRMRAFAEFNDYEVAGEYEDAGKSGKSIEGRDEFNRMVEDIKTGKDDVSFVLVFKLSRFGRNAADVLSTLQTMQDFGVNLICVEDGIDSSKDTGKPMISVLSAVAEIERENIRAQTMEGRIQMTRGHKCDYKKQIQEEILDASVVEIIMKLVSNPRFASLMQEKINMKVDTTAIDQEIRALEKQLKQSYAMKQKTLKEIEQLDPDDRHYNRRKTDLDDRLYRDTSKISKSNMIAFLKANTAYEVKANIQDTPAAVRVIVGEKEQKKMLRSAELLHTLLPGSRLEIEDGLFHGAYSINHPEIYVKELLEMIV